MNLTRIDEDGEAERNVGLGVELNDALRALVLGDLEVILREIVYEPALLVGDGREETDTGNVQSDAGFVAVRRLRTLFTRGREHGVKEQNRRTGITRTEAALLHCRID
jgi:hypothetical protein